MEKGTIICPNCGEEKNLHFNYDYTKRDRPIQDVLCNECGDFFEIEKSESNKYKNEKI
jgi:hypothetical protein